MQFEGVDIYCNPAVYTLPNGDQFICGCQPHVPYSEGVLNKMKKAWTDYTETKVRKDSFKLVTMSSNSDPTKAYAVKIFENGQFECNCKGYMFRKTCSHIEEVKKNGKS